VNLRRNLVDPCPEVFLYRVTHIVRTDSSTDIVAKADSVLAPPLRLPEVTSALCDSVIEVLLDILLAFVAAPDDDRSVQTRS